MARALSAFATPLPTASARISAEESFFVPGVTIGFPVRGFKLTVPPFGRTLPRALPERTSTASPRKKSLFRSCTVVRPVVLDRGFERRHGHSPRRHDAHELAIVKAGFVRVHLRAHAPRAVPAPRERVEGRVLRRRDRDRAPPALRAKPRQLVHLPLVIVWVYEERAAVELPVQHGLRVVRAGHLGVLGSHGAVGRGHGVFLAPVPVAVVARLLPAAAASPVVAAASPSAVVAAATAPAASPLL